MESSPQSYPKMSIRRRTNKTFAPKSSRNVGRSCEATKKCLQEQDMGEEGSKIKENVE
jgi:hypothetical protein